MDTERREDCGLMNKIIKFLKMNGYERRLSLCRNTYARLHRRRFKSIGKKSYFWKPLFLSGTQYMEIGKGVGILPHARVEVIDDWRGQRYASPRLVIGDNVYIGQNLHLTCVESVTIERDVVCSARVTILDNSHAMDDLTASVMDQGLLTKPVKICEGAFIGINSTILPGVTVGKHAIVGANSVVTKDVPDYATVAGVPAREIKKAAIY